MMVDDLKSSEVLIYRELYEDLFDEKLYFI